MPQRRRRNTRSRTCSRSPRRRRSATSSILQIEISPRKRLSQPCSRHQARQVERISVRQVRQMQRQVAEEGAGDREAVRLLPEREGVRMGLARRGSGDEVGRERRGGAAEGIEGRAVERRGGVEGGQAREHVVQHFDHVGRGAPVGVDHDGQVGVWEDGAGAEGRGSSDDSFGQEFPRGGNDCGVELQNQRVRGADVEVRGRLGERGAKRCEEENESGEGAELHDRLVDWWDSVMSRT